MGLLRLKSGRRRVLRYGLPCVSRKANAVIMRIWLVPPVVEFGSLLGYGPPRRKFLVRAGYYVKRILQGADPADLPVEQPTQIELWLNMKTAKTLGITFPAALLATADQVIE